MAGANRKPLKLQFQPLTPDRWSDFEGLFGPRGACGGCWCMAWRLPRKAFEAGKGAGNRRVMLQLVKTDHQPGLLAYHEGQAIGWVSVAPREEFDYLKRSRVLKPLDESPVWSVSCLYVHKDFRRCGVGVLLLRAAIEFVRGKGGRMVEGYPIIPRKEPVPAVFAWTGTEANFKKAGYKKAGEGSPARPIYRAETKRSRTR